jgi:antitoxin VapB
MTATTKLFMSGRSQAIRLPARLRLDASEVRIERVGNALWVQPEPAVNESPTD